MMLQASVVDFYHQPLMSDNHPPSLKDQKEYEQSTPATTTYQANNKSIIDTDFNKLHKPNESSCNKKTDKDNDVSTITVLGPCDILCGRTSTAFNNVGNRRFRTVINQHMNKYRTAPSRHQRSMVILEVTQILQNDLGARFLKRGKIMNGKPTYIEMDEKQVRDKVGHALRDLAAQQTADEKTINAVVDTSKRYTSLSALSLSLSRQSSIASASSYSNAASAPAPSPTFIPQAFSSSTATSNTIPTSFTNFPQVAQKAPSTSVATATDNIIQEQQQQDDILGNFLDTMMESLSDDDFEASANDLSLDPLPLDWEGPTDGPNDIDNYDDPTYF